jgi:hypothetical protein
MSDMTNFSPDFIQSQLALAQNYPAALAEILALRAAVEEKDAEIKRLREVLAGIRDLARTGLPPAGMTEEH